MLILLINFVISVMSRRRWSCRAASIRQLIGAMKRQPGAGQAEHLTAVLVRCLSRKV